MRSANHTLRNISWLPLTVLALALVVGGCKDNNGSSDSDAAVPGPDSSQPGPDSSLPGPDASQPGPDAAPGECATGPLAAPIAGCTPTPVADTGDPYADCVTRINQFRWDCQCLPPLARWTDGESCADEHAEYDSTRSPHDGFRDHICTPGGNAQNECPGWGSIGQIIGGCLQMMWDEGPGEPFSEHGHYINMSSTSYNRVACGFFTTPSGSVWSVQNFSP